MFGVISIDTSTAMSYVGAALVHTVADALNAEYSSHRDIWTVSCDLAGKAPDLVLHTNEVNSKGDLRISCVDSTTPTFASAVAWLCLKFA
ncbi:hypothetical protein AAVH_25631 [Aphelenchoides avenae]|nr:hypothetical protein AAVH_25631 [Aphelenchus avenae]